jgi:cell division protein FtsX
MTTITLKIDNKADARKIYNAVRLLKGVNDVKMDEESADDIMSEIEESLKQVKEIKEGKLPRKSLKQLYAK